MKTFINAAVVLGVSMSAAYAQNAQFRLCTGSETGNYFRAAHEMRKLNQGIVPVSTRGSLDNLDRLTKGECDGAFVQKDSLLVYSKRNANTISELERAGTLYSEQVHLLCNRSSGVSRIVNLNKDHTVAIGPMGSGANTTWESLTIVDKDRYSPVAVSPLTGERALASVADGSAVQCMLWVGAINSSFMVDAQKYGNRVVLVATDDRDLVKGPKDSRGKPIYEYDEIPSDTYPSLQPSGNIWGTKAVKTASVEAVFVSRIKWITENEKPYENILKAFSQASPAIKAIVSP